MSNVSSGYWSLFLNDSSIIPKPGAYNQSWHTRFVHHPCALKKYQGSTISIKLTTATAWMCVCVSDQGHCFVSNYYCSEPLETLQALQAFVAEKEEEEAEYVVLSCTNLSQLI